MLSHLPIARRPLITSRAHLYNGSRCYGVLHAAPPRLAHPGPGPIASSLMSIAGAAIVTWVSRILVNEYFRFSLTSVFRADILQSDLGQRALCKNTAARGQFSESFWSDVEILLPLPLQRADVRALTSADYSSLNEKRKCSHISPAFAQTRTRVGRRLPSEFGMVHNV
ncbi:hypothetical protein F5890DRAFT_917820 [Lentinula detonsa]|uniref:Uncharacterized protein n=1 Tax=Lentinula detonsa TaxID=2804962 RepID=A0AA38Q3U2_9AGAR|nr:hypothetical protein F5890DRAFT_917820 [Lentinula detonsa]